MTNYQKQLKHFNASKMIDFAQWVEDQEFCVSQDEKVLHLGIGVITVKCQNPICPESKLIPVDLTELFVCLGCGISHSLKQCMTKIEE